MALTIKTIKTRLDALGVWSPSMQSAAENLVEISVIIRDMKADIKKHGYTSIEQTREGNDRLVAHPLISELAKYEALKQRLLDALLLTPSALKKAAIELKVDDGFDDIPVG
jgi:hypothetical protein